MERTVQNTRMAVVEAIRRAEERWLADQEAIKEASLTDPLWTVAEAAAYRGVTENAIRHAIRSGRLVAIPFHPPETPPSHRNWRVRRSEVDRFAAMTQKRGVSAGYRQTVERAHNEGFVTITEAAKMLSLSRTRIEHMCRQRHKRLHRLSFEDIWVIRRSEVQALADDRAFNTLLGLNNR
jgi:hypothetical protein